MKWKALFAFTSMLLISHSSLAKADVTSWQNIDFAYSKPLNLHLFLHELARDNTFFTKEVLNNPALSKEDVELFRSAIKVYQDNGVNEREHILFAETEISFLTSNLMRKQDVTSTDCLSVCSQIKNVLPIYDKYFSQKHNAMNNTWKQELTSLLDKYGNSISKKLESAFQKELIGDRHKVQIVYKQGTHAGATTSGKSATTIINSSNEDYKGLYALEMIYHEITHVLALGRNSPLRTKTKSALKKFNLTKHNSLWHAIQFYTVGFAVQHELSKNSIAYEPYANKNELYTGKWAQYYVLMNKYWLPYLNGHSDMEAAILSISKELSDE